MSNTANISAALSFANATGGAARANFPATNFTITGDHYTDSVVSVPTTANGTAIPLGGVATPGGLFFFQNNDPANYVQILTAVSGTAFLRIGPGEAALGRFDAAVTAPAALAHTAAVELHYVFLEP